MIFFVIIVLFLLLFLFLHPYFIVFDTVIAFTGGLGTGKSFLSVLTAIRQLRKNRFKTRVYNFIHRDAYLPMPLLYSSIPIRISKREMSVKLESGHLTLQLAIVPGSVVLLDEIDVFANQFSFGNVNIIETQSKKDLEAIRAGDNTYDSGLFDEEIRLFRHLYSSKACECKFVCNSQATSNIVTVVRRRMNTVFVLSRFRVHRLFFLRFYTVRCRNITITDEIDNISSSNAEDDTRLIIGFMPRYRQYDTHVYSGRSDGIPMSDPELWQSLKTNRLMKAPIERLRNKSRSNDD